MYENTRCETSRQVEMLMERRDYVVRRELEQFTAIYNANNNSRKYV